jgi:hypothetical protein
MIRENGGWNAFRMTPIKEYPCKSYHDAIMEEDRIRLEWNIKPYKPRGLIHNTLDTSVDKTQIKDKINDNTTQDITLQNNTTQERTIQEMQDDNTTHNTKMQDDNTTQEQEIQDDNTMTQDDNTTQEQEIQDDNTMTQDDNTTQEQEIQDDNTMTQDDNTTLQERTTHNTQDDNTTQDNTTHNTQDDNTTQDNTTQDDKTTLQERIIIEPILKLRKLQVEISKEDELKRYYSRVLKKIKSLKSKHIFFKNKTLKHLIS